MADDGPKEGFTAAIDAIGVGTPPAAPAEQLDMLPTLALSPARAGDGTELASGPRGPGRPRGARNRKTDAWVDYLLGRYSSPLIFLAETYSRPTQDLARELGATKLEAFEIQRKAAEALAPFVHQRLPLAVEVDHKSAGVLLVGHIGADRARAAGEALGIDGLALSLSQSEQNQALSDEADTVSHDAKSHEGSK